jgi:hypothetical protein
MTRKSIDGLTDRQFHLLEERYKTLLRGNLQPTLAGELISLFNTKIINEYVGYGAYRPSRRKTLKALIADVDAVVLRFTTTKSWRDVLHIDFYNGRGEFLFDVDLLLKLEEFTRSIYLCIGLVEWYGESWTNHNAKLRDFIEKGIEVAMWDSVISHIQNHLTNVGSDLIIDVNAHVAHVEHHDGTVRFPLTA